MSDDNLTQAEFAEAQHDEALLEELAGRLMVTDPLNIRRVVVTRGNLTEAQLNEVCKPLAVACTELADEGTRWDIATVWSNDTAPFDAKVFGRFLIPAMMDGGLIYAQDDDCCVPKWEDLIEHWKPGHIVCNMPADFQAAYAARRSRIIGFGCLFEVGLIRKTFDRYLKYFPMDDLFLLEADRIFTGLNTERCIMVDVGHDNMPYASDKDRMWKQHDHRMRFEEAEGRIAKVLGFEFDEMTAAELGKANEAN